MECHEITLKVVHVIVHVLPGHSHVDLIVRWRPRSVRVIRERGNGIRVGEREKRDVPPDVVRVWIRPDLVLEPASVDLVIVVRVAEATDAVRRVIKELGIGKVPCV